jgi:GT2 family glycosyltransferase
MGQGPSALGFSISIVIPTWNGLALLKENLPSVQKAAQEYEVRSGSTTEILVVDDGSSDETTTLLPLEFPRINLVKRPTNGGFAAACNSGFKECRGDLVALLNNDVQVARDYFIRQAEHFVDPQVFAVTAKVFDWDAPVFVTGGRFGKFRRGFWSVYFNYDVSLPEAKGWVAERRLLSYYAIGGFATYEGEKLREVGGFNELLSPFHWEDVDLSYRGWKRGWEVRYEPRSRARHRTSATINAHYKQQAVEQASFRNRLLFHWINLHSPILLIWHFLVLLFMLVWKTVTFKFLFLRAFVQAAGCCREVLRNRREERKASKRSDWKVMKLLNNFYRSAPIQVYYSHQEVIEKHQEFK